MYIIIVHGEKPLKNCGMHPAFKERLKCAVHIYHTYKSEVSAIIVTGGETRKGCITEATSGATYIEGRVSCPILTELHARSTSENVRFCKKIVSQNTHYKEYTIIAITSKKRVRRARYLYARLWKSTYPRLRILGAKDFYSPFYILCEFLYLLYDHIDPREYTLARLTKKIFRNTNLFRKHDRYF